MSRSSAKPALILILLIMLEALSACQTPGVVSPMPVRVPPEVAAAFGDCAPGDGSVTLQAGSKDQVIGNLDANWVSDAHSDWQLELTDAFGRTVLTAHRHASTLELSGSLAAKAPKIEIGDDGLLVASGHVVGLKASEIPCLLHSVWPKPWLALADSVEANGSGVLVHFSLPQRDVTYGTPPPPGVPMSARCVDIVWHHWLLFKRELHWCQSPGPRAGGWLRGLGDYSLKWISLDAH